MLRTGASTPLANWRTLSRRRRACRCLEAERKLSKLIFLILVVAAAWWLLKRYVRSLRETGAPPVRPSEDMVRCRRCGVHLPRSESIVRGENAFCCEDHAARQD
jgi:uncharacterized protein